MTPLLNFHGKTEAILMYIAVCVRVSSVESDSFVLFLFLATAVLERV